jgi:hypothetical protein
MHSFPFNVWDLMMQMYPHPNINVPFFSLVYANIMSSPLQITDVCLWRFGGLSSQLMGECIGLMILQLPSLSSFKPPSSLDFPNSTQVSWQSYQGCAGRLTHQGRWRAHATSTSKLDVHTNSNMTYKVWWREPEVFLSSCLWKEN